MALLIKIKKVINSMTNVALVFFVGIMFTLVITQTLSRYIFKFPIFWAEELSRYLMIWSCFLGAALAIRDDEHVALTFLEGRIPKKIRVFIRIFLIIMIMFFLFIFMKNGFSLLSNQARQVSPGMRISMWIPFLALPVGGTLMFFEYLFKLLNQVVLIRKKEEDEK